MYMWFVGFSSMYYRIPSILRLPQCPLLDGDSSYSNPLHSGWDRYPTVWSFPHTSAFPKYRQKLRITCTCRFPAEVPPEI